MRHGWQEIAKFACGVEAFHAFIHTYFWYSGKSLNAFGVTETPTWHKRAAIANALTALALGVYAWGDRTAAARESAAGAEDDESTPAEHPPAAIPHPSVLPS